MSLPCFAPPRLRLVRAGFWSVLVVLLLVAQMEMHCHHGTAALSAHTGPGTDASLGATAFDGLARGRWWLTLTASRSEPTYLLLGTAGLAGMIVLIAGSYLLAVAAAGRLPPGAGRHRPAACPPLAPSLLPIAVGYATAHHFSLLHQGQAGYILGFDPLGRGWDLLGTASWQLNAQVLTPTTIAVVQVGAIVPDELLPAAWHHTGRQPTTASRPTTAC